MRTGRGRGHGGRGGMWSAASRGGGGVGWGVGGWYGDASGAFLVESLDGWELAGCVSGVSEDCVQLAD